MGQEEGSSGKAVVKAGIKVRPGFSREAAKTLYLKRVLHASECELHFLISIRQHTSEGENMIIVTVQG